MDGSEQEQAAARLPPEVEAEILAIREGGASWKEIQERFGLTRQQARHAYQRGLRAERRAARRQEAGDARRRAQAPETPSEDDQDRT